jgi:cytochrome c2
MHAARVADPQLATTARGVNRLALVITRGCVIACTTALLASCGNDEAERGRELIATYGCAGCHQIPGIVGRQGWVGPPLESLRSRNYLSGRLQNTPTALVRWIMDPPSISPGTAMPKLGVTREEAELMAHYLYTLE